MRRMPQPPDAPSGRIAALAVIAACMLAIVSCGGGAPAQPAASSDSVSSAAQRVAGARARADGRIKFLEERAARDPLDVFSLNSLAIEHMQRARETGDVAEISRADDLLRRSLNVRTNDNYDGIALAASVAVTRHDFARGAGLAQQAIAQKPKQAYAYGALGDAYMGLGRYDDADVAFETMVIIEPDLPAFGRRALLFQLRGRFDDAEGSWNAALERAIADGTPEHEAWARVQLGNFFFTNGQIADAGDQYRRSLDIFPGYVHALAGLGRVAAADGDYDAAIENYTGAIERVPLPEYVIALGDVYAAAGDEKSAGEQFALVGAIEQLCAANGVNLDLQIALFNADHDRDIDATVARTRSAYAQQPSIAAADVLSWIEYKAGNITAARATSADALRTGTRDPLYLFHAAMIAKAAGDSAEAKAILQQLERQNARFSVLYSGPAKQALEDIETDVRSPQ